MARKERRCGVRLTASRIAHVSASAIPAFTLVLAASACTEGPTPSCSLAVPIVEVRDFEIVAQADDPFEADAGVPDTGTATTSSTTLPRGRCGPEATMVEDLGTSATYSIVTRECSRLTVSSALLEPLEAGETVELRIWHFPLLPYGPAEATLRVGLEGEWLWSEVVAIPAQSRLLQGRFTTSRAIPVGTPLRWHVSNHGVNSWNFVSATVMRMRPCPTDGSL